MNERNALDGLLNDINEVINQPQPIDEKEEIIYCKNCGKEMVLLIEDEGGSKVYWCYSCGSIYFGGEGDQFLKVGEKPKFEDEGFEDEM
jgi:hypothetical protein